MVGCSKGKTYLFKDKDNSIIKGIFEGKIIKFNPTIIQLRDINDNSILYNVKLELLKEELTKL